ncbi:hypothetical protein CDL12_01563 [Handroanthus impetiginosus]|uniref:Uncharacterized protein n=1 Tax=Handroanthus impetiginosus TaxID=429701 RepID=A0A2G9I7F9_9LAMI|nr:hypothetical protein CDL12_01563 [Handroanthus impetiginosus]
MHSNLHIIVDMVFHMSRQRHQRVHEEADLWTQRMHTKLVKQATIAMEEFRSTHATEEPTPQLREPRTWRLPPRRMVKVNFDRALQLATETLAMVARDSESHCLWWVTLSAKGYDFVPHIHYKWTHKTVSLFVQLLSMFCDFSFLFFFFFFFFFPLKRERG